MATFYFCAGERCPGLPWRASELAHPPSCSAFAGDVLSGRTEDRGMRDGTVLEGFEHHLAELERLIGVLEQHRDRLKLEVAAMRKAVEPRQ